MDKDMKVNIKMATRMGLEYSPIVVAIFMKAKLNIINAMVKEYIALKMG
jgi:hypothetical protein